MTEYKGSTATNELFDLNKKKIKSNSFSLIVFSCSTFHMAKKKRCFSFTLSKSLLFHRQMSYSG